MKRIVIAGLTAVMFIGCSSAPEGSYTCIDKKDTLKLILSGDTWDLENNGELISDIAKNSKKEATLNIKKDENSDIYSLIMKTDNKTEKFATYEASEDGSLKLTARGQTINCTKI